jgi:sRNA-binding carbon storage regulator CsrA
MLVLTRREGERLVLRVPPANEMVEIIISIAESRSGAARVGIDAPAEVKIIREELLENPAPVTADEAGR